MKRVFRWLVVVVVLGAAGFGVYKVAGDRGSDEPPFKLVAVERGNVVDKALATGQIVPRQEFQVKSQISGIVNECFVEVGDRVEAGDQLFAIRPDPTPLELTEAERNVELAAVAFKKAKADLERNRALFESGVLSRGSLDVSQETADQTRIQLELAGERLSLLREGKIVKDRGGVDSVIRSPASGTVLERLVDAGDPVVPLTSYQAGTPLLTLADMSELIFEGTVDEIDVGKLTESLPVRIQIGALPEAEVQGRLVRIAPKAKEEEGSTLFDVEVSIEDRGGIVLRAGYSANANIVIQEKTDVLVVPERLLLFEDEGTFVELPPDTEDAEPKKRAVELGLSDGINIEVVSGLGEGDEVVERPPKQIG